LAKNATQKEKGSKRGTENAITERLFLLSSGGGEEQRVFGGELGKEGG